MAFHPASPLSEGVSQVRTPYFTTPLVFAVAIATVVLVGADRPSIFTTVTVVIGLTIIILMMTSTIRLYNVPVGVYERQKTGSPKLDTD